MQKNAETSIQIMGVPIVSTTMERVLDKIDEICHSSLNKPYFLVTAYSESLLEAQTNKDFKEALEASNQIIPDGVSLVAAGEYINLYGGDIFGNVALGLRIGLDTLRGKHRAVRGVEIFKSVLGSRKYKVFLLGGWGDVAARLASKYSVGFNPGVDNIEDVSDSQNEEMLKEINKYAPDILFVSFGRFKQEVWIAKNLSKLKCKVVIGVGSAFDEVDANWQVPGYVDRLNLKWMWRVIKTPSHLGRAVRAFPVFPVVFFWRYKTKLP